MAMPTARAARFPRCAEGARRRFVPFCFDVHHTANKVDESVARASCAGDA